MHVIHSKWRKPKPKQNRKSATSATNLTKAREKLLKDKNGAEPTVSNSNSPSEKRQTRSASKSTVNDMQTTLQQSATSRKLAFTNILNSSSDVVDDEENMFININVFKVIADKLI